MRILLIAGAAHPIVSQYATKEVEFPSSYPLVLKNIHNELTEESPRPEGVLITDEGLTNDDLQDERDLLFLLEWLQDRPPVTQVILVTRSPRKVNALRQILSDYVNFEIVTCDWVRVPENVYLTAYQDLSGKNNKSPQLNPLLTENKEIPIKVTESERKKSFFDRFRSKPQAEPALEATDRLTRELAGISRGISRIIAITGHRGSGVTSTVVNLASEASKRGLSSIIIDMDAEYRSMNMYFSSFHERTKRSEDINASLIRTLARPQDYMTTAFNIKENMWLTGLGYGFNDRKLMEQFYNNNKLVGMLSLLKSKFNLVILDLPLDLFRTFKESLIHIDIFGLCVPNNLHAILSTIRNVETVLDKENAHYLNAKSKIVVTKYNDRSRFQDHLFTPEKVGEIMVSGLSETFIYEMSTAGYIPYSPHFDSQIENDIPLVNSGMEYEKAFGQMLVRMMEGA